jgi:hypothetical protein
MGIRTPETAAYSRPEEPVAVRHAPDGAHRAPLTWGTPCVTSNTDKSCIARCAHIDRNGSSGSRAERVAIPPPTDGT